MRGLLGFLVLFLLSKKPMHGQEIANELAKEGEKNLVLELSIQLSRVSKI